MPKSKHRKAHKTKVQNHRQKVQDQRSYVKKLTEDLEVAILKAQMDQPAGLLQIMEDQPYLHITGTQPLEAQEIKA